MSSTPHGHQLPLKSQQQQQKAEPTGDTQVHCNSVLQCRLQNLCVQLSTQTSLPLPQSFPSPRCHTYFVAPTPLSGKSVVSVESPGSKRLPPARRQFALLLNCCQSVVVKTGFARPPSASPPLSHLEEGWEDNTLQFHRQTCFSSESLLQWEASWGEGSCSAETEGEGRETGVWKKSDEIIQFGN